jgi:hypothetical protein
MHLVDPGHGFGDVVELEYVDHVEVDHIEDLAELVVGY